MSKLIFYDVDGTLIGKSRTITENNKQALHLARQNEHKVFLCTGRNPVSAFNGLEGLETDGLITLAGGLVSVNNKIIYENSIDIKTLNYFMKLFDDNHIYYSLETKLGNYHIKGLQDFYLDWIDEHYKGDSKAIALLKKDKVGENQYSIHDFNSHEVSVQKMTFVAEDRNDFKRVKDKIEEIFHINYFVKDKSYIDGELILKTCTKVHGIQKILDYYQMNVQDTIAFGDSMNDLQMIKFVNQGIVYENAPEELKQEAIEYFGDPDQDAIYHTMKKLNLI
ncbi:Cof-type HAD-IIB family hydrolase [Candidatus Stoquefichus massiliensis]|uniref:Cof-type HAD-IIB family hydrolase n=1 Tax=Candidatus Stoquefichus massiliensis TaxID=1470350 RepID=UPI00048116BE|nr:Cof-type HAD-IIB family hydrolase [Candidatus Stoquefichus massiliensis]